MNFPIQAAPVIWAYSGTQQDQSLRRQGCDVWNCAQKVITCAAACIPNPLEPRVHLVPGSGVGCVQRLLLTAPDEDLLALGPADLAVASGIGRYARTVCIVGFRLQTKLEYGGIT